MKFGFPSNVRVTHGAVVAAIWFDSLARVAVANGAIAAGSVDWEVSCEFSQ